MYYLQDFMLGKLLCFLSDCNFEVKVVESILYSYQFNGNHNLRKQEEIT